MPLFLISYADVNGASLDLFVEAQADREALDHWIAYYNLDIKIIGPDEDGGPSTVALWTVARQGTNGPLPWDQLHCSFYKVEEDERP